MIQYQYYHTGNGYVAALSMDAKSGEGKNLEKLFEVARKKSGNNFFAYAPLQDGNMFFVQGSTEKDLFVNGLYGRSGDLAAAPAAYIGTLKSQPTQSSPGAILEEGELPSPVFSLTNVTEEIVAITPALVEALLCGRADKQIVISASGRKQAASCMKFLSHVLPTPLMRRVGFCIGCTSLPEQISNVMGDMGEDLSFSLKILFPEGKKLDFEADSFAYYVFDIPSGQHSLGNEAGSVSKLLSTMDLRDEGELEKLHMALGAAFSPDGSVDKEKLEQLAALQLFCVQPDPATARKIVDSAFSGGLSNPVATAEAIKLLLTAEGSDAADSTTVSRIAKVCERDGKVVELAGDALFYFLAPKGATLGTAEKRILADIVYKDTTGQKFQQLLSMSLQGSYEPIAAAFEVFVLAIGRCFADGMGTVADTTYLLTNAVRFFDFNNFASSVPVDDWLDKGEPMFNTIAEQTVPEIRVLLTSVLMASAFLSESEWKDMRVAGLKQLMIAGKISKIDQFAFVLSVWRCLAEMVDYMPEIVGVAYFDFLCNCTPGRQWVGTLLSSLSPEELLSAEQMTRTEFGFRPYESMLTMLRDRLLDASYVRENIRGEALEKRFTRFFEALPEESKLLHGGIYRYITQLGNEKSVNEMLRQFRFEYADECYQTLSAKDRKAITGKSGQMSLDESNAAEAVEKTFEVFSRTEVLGGSNNKNHVLVRKLISLGNGILWMVLAALLAEIGTYVLGARDHYTVVYKFFLFPILSAIGAGSFFWFNRETNDMIKQNVITAIEVVALVVVLLGAFRLAVL